LMVEYAGDTADAVKRQVYQLEELRKARRIGYAASLAFNPDEVKAIWGVRKAGLGLLLGTKGDKKTIAFVADTAVEPAKLPEFSKRFREIITRHDAIAGYYGHCSVGCMHIRPLINLKEPSEVKRWSPSPTRFPILSSNSTGRCPESTATDWPEVTLIRNFSVPFFTRRFAR